jgi:hypothetical protein
MDAKITSFINENVATLDNSSLPLSKYTGVLLFKSHRQIVKISLKLQHENNPNPTFTWLWN